MMAFPHKIAFLRHGETEWNVEGRLQGWRDVPLNGRGEAQARGLGQALRRLYGEVDLDARFGWACSPLARARRTMALAREEAGLDPDGYAADPRLRELGFGVCEGMTWRQVKARYPLDSAARAEDRWHWRAPEGESYADVAARLDSWLETLAGDVVVVSHGGVARALLHRLAGVAMGEATVAEIAQGRILEFADGSAHWI